MAPQTAAAASRGPTADFDANRFPLDPGLRLLEASAGTGKTFALAHLALRLVTERALPLRRLLVVTFTEAAAAELRERMGRRLQEALSGLRDPERDPPDAVLAEWLAERRAEAGDGGTTTLEMRLLLALEELDGADITTIHGFCQRSLRRHALEARRPPTLQLDNGDDTLPRQVVHSYWREQVLALPPHLIQGLGRKGMKPDSLSSLLRALDGDPGLELDPLPDALPVEASLAETLPDLWRQRWERFSDAWRSGGAELVEALFSQANRWKAEGLDYRPYTLKKSKRWDRSLVDAFVAQPVEAGGPPTYPRVLAQEMLTTFLHPGPFCQRVRANGDHGDRPITLPQRPLMEAVADLVDGPAELALLHACHWTRRELARRRERLGLCSYGQLLSDLDPGLGATAPTPLLEAVAKRYGAALIDEFQDTDPMQWRILRLAFGGGGHLVVMVGDPKQAIYRFRGGDLATYLAARALADSRYQMRENRRSTPELIDALNQFCARGLPRSGLALPPLEARALRGGDGQPPVDLLWLGGDGGEATAGKDPGGAEGLPSRSAIEARLPAQIAAYVAGLLRAPPVLREGGAERPLDADDVCVLVHTHAQAEALRQALGERGIASRLVSQADVFATSAATALQRLLDAVAEPSESSRLRLLAASPLMGWTADRIAEASPLHWSALAARLQQMGREWPQQGLLGPLAAVLGPEQMARLAQGGRFLADLQQVAELVQHRLHHDHLGPHAAARWLRRRRQRSVDPVPEAEQTHSDKVRQAVSVVTVHRSKGLEYPLVICPYLWLDAGESQGEGRRWRPDPEAPPRLDLHRNRHWGPGYDADRVQRLDGEAERERLAYVALTRAMHRLVLAWVPARGRQANPLFAWLFPRDPVPDPWEEWPGAQRSLEEWRQRLAEGIAERQLPLRLLDPPAGEPLAGPAAGERRDAHLALGPVPQRTLLGGWARSSYTSWTHGRRSAGLDATSPGPEALEEGLDISDPGQPFDPSEDGDSVLGAAESGAPPSPQGEPGPWPERGLWADLPGGSGFGGCLHRLLEHLDYGAPLATPEIRALVERELRREGLADTWAAPLMEALQQMLVTPFGGPLGGLRPADLPASQRLNELHFDLSLRRALASELAQAFRDHPGGLFDGEYAEALERLPVHHRGFLTGSIDLVFPTRVDGQDQWWVLDWKSNWLGRRDGRGAPSRCGPEDYGPDAMRALMANHHYPLQAHLYLVALHRYLAWRLPAYDPERHLGGYVYVFVRGTPGAEGERALPGPIPGMLLERPPLGRLLALHGALGVGPPGWTPGSHP